MKKPDSHKNYSNKDDLPQNDLWTDGLICAFEFIRGRKKPISSGSGSKIPSTQHIDGEYSMIRVPEHGQAEVSSPRLDKNKLNDTRSSETSSFDNYKYSKIHQSSQFHGVERLDGSHWVPIGWARISELVKTVQVDTDLLLQQFEPVDDESDLTVADLAAPYWERPVGPIWWCHVLANNPSVQAWLSKAEFLHPAVSLALRDESRLISEKMKHLLYEVDFFFKYI
jgi:hypothetical protein